MDDFRRNISPPTSIKESVTKKSSQSDLKPRSSFSNENDHQMSLKKPMTPKHFMSPTISAESKARRRILGDKNAPPSEDTADLRYPLTPLSSNLPVSDHLSNSASNPYDPVKNYLSPRPTFRLYDPNKKFQAKRSGNGMSASQLSEEMTASLGSLPSSPSQEIEEDLDMDEFQEDEEVEEEKHGFFYKVLKLLVVFSALFLSTLYISTMNSPGIPGLSSRNQWGLKDVYSKIQDGVFQFSVNDFVPGSMFFNQTQENGRDMIEEADSGGFSKKGQIQGPGLYFNQIDPSNEGESVRETLDSGLVSDTPEKRRDLREETESGEIVKDDGVKQVFESPGLPVDQIDLSSEGESMTETLDSVLGSETRALANLVVYPDEMLDDKQLNTEAGRDDVSTGVPAFADGLRCLNDDKKVILGDILKTCDFNGNLPSGFSEENRNFDLTFKKEVIVIGVTALLAAIVGYIYLKYSRSSNANHSPEVHPKGEFMVPKKDRGIEEKEEFVKAEYHISPLPSLHAQEQRFAELYKSRVPTVQLLGEYEVTTQFTRRTPKSERRQPISAEAHPRKPASSPTVPSASKLYSATISNSTERFTPQQNNEKKEERSGGDGLAKASATSLRRSNRLRSKTVVSPKS